MTSRDTIALEIGSKFRKILSRRTCSITLHRMIDHGLRHCGVHNPRRCLPDQHERIRLTEIAFIGIPKSAASCVRVKRRKAASRPGSSPCRDGCYRIRSRRVLSSDGQKASSSQAPQQSCSHVPIDRGRADFDVVVEIKGVSGFTLPISPISARGTDIQDRAGLLAISRDHHDGAAFPTCQRIRIITKAAR